VCLSARITRKPRSRTSPNFLCVLPVDVAWSSSDGIAMLYVLPVLWTPSHFHTVGLGPIGRITHGRMAAPVFVAGPLQPCSGPLAMLLGEVSWGTSADPGAPVTALAVGGWTRLLPVHSNRDSGWILCSAVKTIASTDRELRAGGEVCSLRLSCNFVVFLVYLFRNEGLYLMCFIVAVCFGLTG